MTVLITFMAVHTYICRPYIVALCALQSVLEAIFAGRYHWVAWSEPGDKGQLSVTTTRVVWDSHWSTGEINTDTTTRATQYIYVTVNPCNQ